MQPRRVGQSAMNESQRGEPRWESHAGTEQKGHESSQYKQDSMEQEEGRAYDELVSLRRLHGAILGQRAAVRDVHVKDERERTSKQRG